jgi:hypothetical protein
MSIEQVSVVTLIRQKLFRCWIEKLSLAEFVVCCFIFERTHAFNKPMEAISVRHFLHGIDGRNFRQGGIPIGRTQLMAVLNSLEDRGAIFRTRISGKRTMYGLNPGWPEEPCDSQTGYPQRAVDNSINTTGHSSRRRTRGVRPSERTTSDSNSRNKLVIVEDTQPSAAVPLQQQQKEKVSRSGKATYKREQSSRGAS